MKRTWNLDTLYSSFESEVFIQDFEKLKKELTNLNAWSGSEDTKESIEEFLTDLSKIYMLHDRLQHFIELTFTTDTNNGTALKYMDQLENTMTKLTKPMVRFQYYLKEIPNIRTLEDQSDLIREHIFVLEELKQESQYLLSEQEEIIISKLKPTGSSAWENLQSKISSSLMIPFEENGEIKNLPLAHIRNLASDINADVRKRAYEAELGAYPRIEESTAASLNAIKGEVNTIGQMRGYESALEEALIKSRMDPAILDAMLMAMKNRLPILEKYFFRKGELLGHKNGLPFYDLFAPISSEEPKYTLEESRKLIVEKFRTFSDELADFTDFAFNNQWIDIDPKEGKVGGAFCAYSHSIKESRILTNFTGSFDDVSTLAHELGHAYHGSLLTEESVLNIHYPMPLAETASIFCETIVTQSLLENASKNESANILEKVLQNAGQVITDIYSRFLFESEVLNKRKDHPIMVDELKEIMLNAQKETYGKGLDENYLHPYMWACKPHYYSGSLSFYNFPYAFGLLFAKGLYSIYEKEGDSFIEKYKTLLKVTGKMKIADVTQLVGIDITRPAFWEGSLDLIEKEVDLFLELTKDKI